MKLLITAVCLMISFAVSAESITLYAAASTTNAVNEIISIYSEKTGEKVKASFASSGTLAKQIENSAPADIFISANPKWMKWIDEKGLMESDSIKPLLSNRMVLIAPASSSEKIENVSGESMLKMLAGKRIVMAAPEHAPAGQYAKQVFENLGIWEDVKHMTAGMQTVRAVLAMIEKGAAPYGVVYSSDASVSKNIKVLAVFDRSLHSPVVYPAGIIKKNSSDRVKDFYTFLKSSEAEVIFSKYGFEKAQ